MIPKEERDGWLKAINGMEEKYRAANAITEEECAEFAFSRCLLKHADEADRVIEQLRNVIEEYKEDLKQQLAIATGGGCCHSVPCRCVATITDLYRKRFVRIDTALAAGRKS